MPYLQFVGSTQSAVNITTEGGENLEIIQQPGAVVGFDDDVATALLALTDTEWVMLPSAASHVMHVVDALTVVGPIRTVLADAGDNSDGIPITLPLSSEGNREVTVRNIGATNPVVLTASGTDEIEGESTIELAPGGAMTVVADGAHSWFALSQIVPAPPQV